MEKTQRIREHPILDFESGKRVRYQFEGQWLEGYENESIAAALFASGVKIFSHSKRFNHPTGWFCGIGKCSSCLMRVNGIPNVRTCITQVEEGVRVALKDKKGVLPDEPDVKIAKKRSMLKFL